MLEAQEPVLHSFALRFVKIFAQPARFFAKRGLAMSDDEYYFLLEKLFGIVNEDDEQI